MKTWICDRCAEGGDYNSVAGEYYRVHPRDGKEDICESCKKDLEKEGETVYEGCT